VTAFKAAREPGALFIRFYEVFGQAVDAEFAFPFKVKNAQATDLLEKEIKELPFRGKRVTCALRPCEIGNMKIFPEDACQ
jgi:alpha-mannosidase